MSEPLEISTFSGIRIVWYSVHSPTRQDPDLDHISVLVEITHALNQAGPLFCNWLCGSLFCPSWIMCASTWHSLFNTVKVCDIITTFAAVRFRPVPLTLGVVINTVRWCKFRKLNCISLYLLLCMSVYMLSICTSTTYLVSDHITWHTSPAKQQKTNALCGGGIQGSVFGFDACCGSGLLDTSSWSGSAYSTRSLIPIGRNHYPSHQTIGASTQLLYGHSPSNCPQITEQFIMSYNTEKPYATQHLWTLYTSPQSCEGNLPNSIFSFACCSSVNSRSTLYPSLFGIKQTHFQFANCNFKPLLIVQGCANLKTWCDISFRASWSSVWMPCNKQFTVEFSASVPCFSLIVSSCRSSGVSETSHMVWLHQRKSEWNPSAAVTWSCNTIHAFITTFLYTQFIILFWWRLSNIPILHKQYQSWLLLDCFSLDVKILCETSW